MGTFGFLEEHVIKSRKFPSVLDSLGELMFSELSRKSSHLRSEHSRALGNTSGVCGEKKPMKLCRAGLGLEPSTSRGLYFQISSGEIPLVGLGGREGGRRQRRPHGRADVVQRS